MPLSLKPHLVGCFVFPLKIIPNHTLCFLHKPHSELLRSRTWVQTHAAVALKSKNFLPQYSEIKALPTALTTSHICSSKGKREFVLLLQIIFYIHTHILGLSAALANKSHLPLTPCDSQVPINFLH